MPVCYTEHAIPYIPPAFMSLSGPAVVADEYLQGVAAKLGIFHAYT